MAEGAKIIAALGGLGAAELRAVRAACDRLLGDKTAPAATAGPLYEALLQVTGQHIPFAKFSKSVYGKSWALNERLVLKFVGENWPQAKQQVQQLALLKYLIGLLIEDMRRCDRPTELGALALNLHTIPDVYEYAFPGYRVAGLNHVVLAQVLNGTAGTERLGKIKKITSGGEAT